MLRRKGHFIYRFSIILVLTFFCSLTAFCQPPVQTPEVQNVGQMPSNVPDPTKLTRPALQELLKDNNKAGTDKTKDSKDIMNRLKNKSLDKDSTQKDNIKQGLEVREQTYGSRVFQNAAVTDLSELSTPPLDYPLGVGDHIIVALWGAAEFQEDYIIARDGSIFPSGLGKIYVQNLTFENMRSVISARFLARVPEGTNIAISLGQPRSISVNVVGEVENPGPVTVSAFANAFSIIALAGGTNEFGNLREITVKRGGRVIASLDVYKYLNTGELGRGIFLQNNDFVLVGQYEKKVLATGQFKRPMYYQLKKNEGIKDLLKYSGGLTADALGSTVKVIRTEDEKQVQRDVNVNAIINRTNDPRLMGQDFVLNDGDIVKADLIKPGISNKVEIRGEVNYPGAYELRLSNNDNRLFAVINRAGGVTRNTYLPRAYIFRGAGDSTNLKSNKLEVNLTGLDKNSPNSLADENNVILQPNDVVQLFTQSDFGEQQFVEIFGEVRKPGRQKKYGGMSLQDLLYLSGGIKPSAEYGRLEISSIVDMDSAQLNLKPTRTVVKAYNILPNLELDSAAAHILLKPYDQVFVRRNPTFELQQNITMEGLVKYPGMYPRLSKSEKLSSYVNRSGGLGENADVLGALLFRTKPNLHIEKKDIPKPKFDSLGTPITDTIKQDLSDPVSIDLYKALKYPGSKYDVVLQEGDVIFIPEINPFVSVGGAVQSPLKITFDKEHTTLPYYIDKAGGFGIRPWRKRIYVKYASGKSKRTHNFFFLHFYPRVEQGSVVVVPVRPEGKEVGDIAVQVVTATIPIILSAILIKYLNK
ncbi:MAG: SLBB domain-containing protein [Ferruginibacter sp.]